MCHKVLTKAAIAISLVLVFSMGAACPPDADRRITVTEESMIIGVTEVEGGITSENLSNADCTVYVRSPEGSRCSSWVQAKA